MKNENMKTCTLILVLLLLGTTHCADETRTGQVYERGTCHEEGEEEQLGHVENDRCKDGVDLVYTWVNGSDPWHVDGQRKYIPLLQDFELKHRFRDFGVASTLKFSLRSQRKWAPWLKHVYIVTANRETQVPSWLREDYEAYNVTIVDHLAIFPESAVNESLPTFNSCAIEMNLHRIPNLRECFLYLNDDVLFFKEMSLENTFWPSGMDHPFAYTNYIIAPYSPRNQPEWGVKLSNVAREIRQVTRLGRDQILQVGHHGHFFQKSVVKELLEGPFRKSWQRTMRERWRTDNSFWLPFAYSNYVHWKYNATRRRVHAFYHSLDSIEGLESALKTMGQPNTTKFQWICLNDAMKTEETEKEMIPVLFTTLNTLYPNPSPFEK